jgi:hypothetical protein
MFSEKNTRAREKAERDRVEREGVRDLLTRLVFRAKQWAGGAEALAVSLAATPTYIGTIEVYQGDAFKEHHETLQDMYLAFGEARMRIANPELASELREVEERIIASGRTVFLPVMPHPTATEPDLAETTARMQRIPEVRQTIAEIRQALARLELVAAPYVRRTLEPAEPGAHASP